MIKKIISAVLVISLSFESSGYSQTLPFVQNPVHFYSSTSAFSVSSFRPFHLRSLSYQKITGTFDVLFDKGDMPERGGPVVSRDARQLIEYFMVGLRLPNSAFWVNLRPDAESQVIDASLARTDAGRVMLDADLKLKKDTARFLSPRDPEGKKFWDSFYQKANELFGVEISELPSFTRVWIVPGEIILRESAQGVYVCKALLNVVSEQDYLKDSANASIADERFRQLSEYANRQIAKLILPKLTRKINSSKDYALLRQVFYSLILAQWCKQRISLLGKESAILAKIDTRDLSGVASQETWSVHDYFASYRKSCQQGEIVEEETVATSLGMEVRTYFSGGVNFLKLAEPANTPGTQMIKSDIPVSALNYLIRGRLNKDFVLDIPAQTDKQDVSGTAIRADGGLAKKSHFVWLIPGAILLATLFIPGFGLVYRAGSMLSGSGGHAAAASVPGVLSGAAPGAATASALLVNRASIAPDPASLVQTAQRMIPAHGAAHYVNQNGMELTVGEGGAWNLHTSAHHGMDIASGSSGSWGTASSQQMLHTSGLPDAQDFMSQPPSLHTPFHVPFVDPSVAPTTPGAVSSIPPSSGFDPGSYISHVLEPVSLFIQANPIPAAAAIMAVACVAGYVIYQRMKSDSRRPIVAIKETDRSHAAMKKNDLALTGPAGKKIKHIFRAWNTILEGNDSLSDKEQKEILLLTKQLLSATVLTPGVLKFHINEMVAIQDRLAAQSFETVRLLKKQIKSRTSDDDSVDRTSAVILQLLLVGEYSIEYRHALDFPSNLKLMSGYYLNPEHVLERMGLVRGIRLLWGIESETNRSKRLFTEQLRKIVDIGNTIETHLYPDPGKNIRDFQKCSDYFIERADDKKIGLDHEWRLRRITSRLFTFVPLSLLLTVLAVIFWGAPAALSPVTLLITGLSGFGLNIGIHRFFFFLGRNGNKYTHMNEILQAEKSMLKNYFSPLEKPSEVHLSGDSMLGQEYTLTAQALRDELCMKKPRTDIIVIVAESDQKRQEKLRIFVEQSRGRLIRHDVPVVFVPSGAAGKTVEGVSGAFNVFGQEVWRDVQARYPRLSGKSISDVRAVCIMAGGANFDKIFDALQFPAVPELDRPPSPIELALINGYRASQSLAQEGRFGTSLVFGDGALIGPIRRKGDITLVGTWASYRQMTDQGFGLILVDDYNSCKVRKFYEKTNLESVKNKLEARSLSSSYDFNNQEKRQFLGLAGMIIFSFDDRERFNSFVDLLKTVSDFEEGASSLSHPVKFIPDFLVPLIMKANDENIYTYLGIKLAQYEDDATRKFYGDLFDLYEKKAGGFDIRAYVPYHRELYYAKVDAKKSMPSPEWLTKPRISKDGGKDRPVRLSAVPGGIDFRSLVPARIRTTTASVSADATDTAALVGIVNILRQQELSAQPTDAGLLQMLN